MSDILLAKKLPSLNRIRWVNAVESGAIFPINKVAKKLGLKGSFAITKELFTCIFPYAEEAVKGKTFEERIEDILNLIEKNKYEALQDRGLEVNIHTNIKKVHSFDKIETYKHGKWKDRRIFVTIDMFMDGDDKPCVLLGAKGDIL